MTFLYFFFMYSSPCCSKGYVLHRQSYREHSFLITWFDESGGLLRGVLRGVSQKGRGRKKALCEPFCAYQFTHKPPRSGELHAVYETTSLTSSLPPRHRLSAAFELNEYLFRLLSPAPSSTKLFWAYERWLACLLVAGEESEARLSRERLHVLWRLLEVLGLEPPLSHDILGAPIDVDAHYQLSEEGGFVRAASEVALITGRVIAAAQQHKTSKEGVVALGKVVQARLRPYLRRS